MNGKRFNLIMIGVVAVLGLTILVAVYGANSLLKQKSNRLMELRTENQVLEQQQITLANAKRDIEKYSDLNRVVKLVVPQDKDQAQAVRELSKIAKESGVKLSSITFPNSDLGSKKAVPAAPAEGGAVVDPTAPVVPKISQTEQVKGIDGVFNLPITVQVQETAASYGNLIKFLDKLEQNRRTAHVTSINIIPTADPSQVKFQLTVSVYLKP